MVISLTRQVLLHRVKVLRGIRESGTCSSDDLSTHPAVLLTPQNTNVIGGEIEALDLSQPEQFVESLRRRIEAASDPPAAPSGSKRTKARNTSVSAGPSASTRKKPKIETKAATRPRPGQPATPSAIAGSSTGPGTRTSSMGRRSMPITIDDTDDEVDMAQRARQARAAAILAATVGHDHTSRSNDEMGESEDEYGLDDEADESFLRHVELAEAAAKEGKRGVDSSGFRGQADYDNDEFDELEEDEWADDSFLRHIDQVEAAASGGSDRARSSRSGAGGSRDYVQADQRGRPTARVGANDEDDGFPEELDDSVTIMPNALFAYARSSGTEQTSQNSRGKGRGSRDELVGRRGGSTQTAIEIIEISD